MSMTDADGDARVRELAKQARLDYLGISEDELRVREPGWFMSGPIPQRSELEYLSHSGEAAR